MSTFSKKLLSASANGRLIKVVAVATPGTAVHTAVAGTSDLDEVWLYAVNTDIAAHKLTIEYGGTTSPDDLIELTVQPEAGLVLVVSKLLLQNSLAIKAFADAANIVLIGGFVNRITV